MPMRGSRTSKHTSWSFQDVVGAKSSEDVGILMDLKGKAITLADPPFPDFSRIFHLFDSQGRMVGVLQEYSELSVHQALDGIW